MDSLKVVVGAIVILLAFLAFLMIISGTWNPLTAAADALNSIIRMP